MMRKLIIFTLLVAGIAAVIALPAATKPRGTNGKIVVNVDNNLTGQEQVYTVDPDGTDMQFLADDTEAGQWSPDGTKITLSSGGYVDVDTGAFTDLHLLGGLYPGLFMFCNVWSPNGARLACEVFGEDPSRNGIYTIRSSDGGDLQRVTSAEFDDCPADYSPNSRRLLVSNGQLSVVESNGNGLHKITPDGMRVDFCSGSWSPQGNQIAFSAKVPETDRSTIWVVHLDGTGLRQIPVPGCGGPRRNPTSIGCQKPVWSPDGQKIMFERHFLIPNDHFDLYTVNPDGSGLVRVKDTPDLDEGGGDWGTHPLTP